eukprot:5486229-Pyramimonas_sp.AAC.1
MAPPADVAAPAARAAPPRLPGVAGVSAGLSRGANPRGTLLALDRWRDLGLLMPSHGVDFF